MPSDATDLRRILIIGSAGSGKSTAARMIGDRLGLPVYHMDKEVFWLPGWEERSRADQLDQVKRVVAEEAWVFEGNNSRTFDIRIARARMLIWLDLSITLRLWRVTRRAILQNGQTRPDMAEGCEERIRMLPAFWAFILRTNRDSRRKQKALFEAVTLPKHRLTSARAVNAFVADL
ncbi:MAG: hypothetical protein AAFU41_05595 [Pseudomonadota bacterium]